MSDVSVDVIPSTRRNGLGEAGKARVRVSETFDKYTVAQTDEKTLRITPNAP